MDDTQSGDVIKVLRDPKINPLTNFQQNVVFLFAQLPCEIKIRVLDLRLFFLISQYILTKILTNLYIFFKLKFGEIYSAQSLITLIQVTYSYL